MALPHYVNRLGELWLSSIPTVWPIIHQYASFNALYKTVV